MKFLLTALCLSVTVLAQTPLPRLPPPLGPIDGYWEIINSDSPVPCRECASPDCPVISAFIRAVTRTCGAMLLRAAMNATGEPGQISINQLLLSIHFIRHSANIIANPSSTWDFLTYHICFVNHQYTDDNCDPRICYYYYPGRILTG